jgi:hypothetical protein
MSEAARGGYNGEKQALSDGGLGPWSEVIRLRPFHGILFVSRRPFSALRPCSRDGTIAVSIARSRRVIASRMVKKLRLPKRR